MAPFLVSNPALLLAQLYFPEHWSQAGRGALQCRVAPAGPCNAHQETLHAS